MSTPLFTLKMLSEAVAVPVTALRLWQRRGLLRPAKQVGRLAYFDPTAFQNAKIFAQLYHAGLRAGKIADKIESLRNIAVCQTDRLDEMPVEIDGREIYLAQNGKRLDPRGQSQFEFEAGEKNTPVASETVRFDPENLLDCLDEAVSPEPPDIAALCDAAWELEEDGDDAAALALYRSALLMHGPDASICFQIAELLYRRGDLTGARERYFMALEIDENFVEARANLGCVLAELGDLHLAVETFSGALRFHPDYADVHFHLAKTLEELGETDEAAHHRRLYETLVPESPWNSGTPHTER